MSESIGDCSITIWLYFSTNEYSVDEITEYLGLEPDFSLRVGEVKQYSRNPSETNVWRIQERQTVNYEDHFDAIGSIINKVYLRVEAVLPKFRKLADQCGGHLMIGAIASDDIRPSLTKETVRRIAELGVDIEMDLISAAEEDESAK